MDQITDFLSEYREKGLSSPTGNHWIDFYKFLKVHQKDDQSKPPMFLALGASGESDTVKHHRLHEQLEWAEEAGVLDKAIERLESIDESKWNGGPLDSWDKEYY